MTSYVIGYPQQATYPAGQAYAVRTTGIVHEQQKHYHHHHHRNRKSKYTVCLVCLIILLVALLIGALIWGAIMTDKAISRNADTAQTPPPPPPPPITIPTTRPPVTIPTTAPPVVNTGLIHFDCSGKSGNPFTVSGKVCVDVWTWDTSLSSSSSVRFKDYAGEFCGMVDKVFDTTSLSGGNSGCSVQSLSEHPNKGVCVDFYVQICKALDISVIGLYRLVLKQLHCGLNDKTLNYRFSIYNEEVEFKELGSSSMILHPICTNSGACIKSALDYLCSCDEGFRLTYDAFVCEDFDECRRYGGLCDHKCTNTVGSYDCSCDDGYLLAEDLATCQDINECDPTSPTHNCNVLTQATCVNRVGDFYCQCPAGMELKYDDILSRYDCVDINECELQMDNCLQVCTNVPGSYQCDCKDGYLLMSEDKTCQDVNECDDNNPLHNCGTASPGYKGCLNEPAGSFTCLCNPGYELYYDDVSQEQTCRDINECNLNEGGCEQMCTNLVPFWECSCCLGYTLDSDRRTCNDDNECLLNTDQCESDGGGDDPTCVNNDGSYDCVCPDGFFLNPDGISCTDIEECQDAMADCTQRCTNTPGSYTCACNDGYSWDAALGDCADVDECDTGTPCSGNSQTTGETLCINTVGSYHCICEIGYELQEGTCVNYNECLNATVNLCNPGGVAVCTDEEGSTNPLGYDCSCPATFWELNADEITCDDVDECASDPCASDVNGNYYCVNNVGADYDCVCPPGTVEHPNAGGPGCTDIDECDIGDPKNNCDQICVNDDRTVSATAPKYHCTCNPGYVLNADGSTCDDVDECTQVSPPCGSGTCVNNIGGYTCDNCFVNDAAKTYQGPAATSCITFAISTDAATIATTDDVVCTIDVTGLDPPSAIPSLSRFEWVLSQDGNEYQTLDAGSQTNAWDATNAEWTLTLDVDAAVPTLNIGDTILCIVEYSPPDAAAVYNDNAQVVIAS